MLTNLKLMFLIVIISVLSYVICEGNENVPNVPKARDICSNTCSCDKDKGEINCSSKSLLSVFTVDEWKKLTDSNITINKLDMSTNELAHLTQFPSLNIKVLNLSFNRILKIEPQTFKFLENLTELDLSNNRLTSKLFTPDIFEGEYDPSSYEPLKLMKVLKLGNNMLHTLNQDMFEHLTTLEVLSLESNPFRVIDAHTEIALTELLHLQHLDLSYMDLEALPKNLLHTLKDLKTLNLTGNLFTKLPEGLIYAQSLTTLNLNENTIRAIEGENIFPIMSSLEVVHLCYMNELTSVGESGLSGLKKLKELHMNNNHHLNFIHESALVSPDENPGAETEVWPPLEKVYLHNNNLSTISNHLLGNYDRIQVIDIRFNHWSCDCENQWMARELVKSIEEKNPQLVHGLHCAEPSEMTGETLLTIEQKHEEMRCLDKYGNKPERDGALLIGILVGLITALPICIAVFLCYRRRCGLGSNRGPADFSRAFYQRADMADDAMHI